MRRGDQRSHLGGVVERIANSHFFKCGYDGLRKAIVYRLLHENATARATILSGIAQGGGDGGGDGAVDVAVGEDDVR